MKKSVKNVLEKIFLNEDLKNVSKSNNIKKVTAILVAVSYMICSSVSANAYEGISALKNKINLNDRTKKVLKIAGIGVSGAFLGGATLGTMICGGHKLFRYINDRNVECIPYDYTVDDDVHTSFLKSVNIALWQKDNQLTHLKGLRAIKPNFANDFNSSCSKDKAVFTHKSKNYTIEIQTNSDIIVCPCDVIVNAANEHCLGGDGVDGAFNDAGGTSLKKQRSDLPIVEGTANVRCRTGNLRVTGVGNISKRNSQAKCIFHAVGPTGDAENRQQKLYSVYYNCLETASELGFESIAFPSISTGLFVYPVAEAAETAMNAVNDFFDDHENTSLKRVKWCLCAGSNQNYNDYIKPFIQSENLNNANNNENGSTTQIDEKNSIVNPYNIPNDELLKQLPETILRANKKRKRYELNTFKKPTNIDEKTLTDAVLYKIYNEIIEQYKNGTLIFRDSKVVSIQGMYNTLGIFVDAKSNFDEKTLKSVDLIIVVF